MKNFAKKIYSSLLCITVITMQASATTITTGDTGLGNGLGGANITGASGGYVNTELGNGSANVNVNGDSHIIWGNLNLNRGENLNFNAVDGANGVTVVNTVTSGMSQIYGNISSNSGIAKLIISNPNGMLYDGASFTTAGDLMLTTQALGVSYVNGNLNIQGLDQEATGVVTIKNSDFSIGGEYNITAPSIDIIKSVISATKGLKLITADGQNFLVSPTVGQDEYHSAVRLEAVEINGDVYILSDKDIVKVVNGGKINGNLNIVSDGNVALNYSNNGEKFHVTGNANIQNDGRVSYLRNSKVDGNLNMSNSGGFLEINGVEVGGNADLKTTVKTNEGVKHFIHVIGENKVGGNLTIDSAHNIHIGGYNNDSKTGNPSDLRKEGSLTVGGDLTAVARGGSIAVTVDTKAENIKLGAGLNIITDGKATLDAKTYQFIANNYIGGVDSEQEIINVMEGYKALPAGGYTYLNITGGDVNKIKTSENGYALIKSEGNMKVDGVNSGNVLLTSNQNDITIGDDVHANVIKVGGETKNLKVGYTNRDYTLKYTNIRDNEVKTINRDEEITYEFTNGENGYNKGTQTANNTYLVGPDKPDPPNPPQPDEPTIIPDDNNENVRVLKGLERDKINTAIDANQVYTPVAFAADLDDEIKMGVRKNVDGSVTVVKAFTPSH